LDSLKQRKTIKKETLGSKESNHTLEGKRERNWEVGLKEENRGELRNEGLGEKIGLC